MILRAGAFIVFILRDLEKLSSAVHIPGLTAEHRWLLPWGGQWMMGGPLLAWGLRPSGAPRGSPNRAGRDTTLWRPCPSSATSSFSPVPSTCHQTLFSFMLLTCLLLEHPLGSGPPSPTTHTLPLDPLLGRLLQEAFPDSQVWGRRASLSYRKSPHLPRQHVSLLPYLQSCFLILCPALELHEDRGLVCHFHHLRVQNRAGLALREYPHIKYLLN